MKKARWTIEYFQLKEDWCYNGHWFHTKCKGKETEERIKAYLESVSKFEK